MAHQYDPHPFASLFNGIGQVPSASVEIGLSGLPQNGNNSKTTYGQGQSAFNNPLRHPHITPSPGPGCNAMYGSRGTPGVLRMQAQRPVIPARAAHGLSACGTLGVARMPAPAPKANNMGSRTASSSTGETSGFARAVTHHQNSQQLEDKTHDGGRDAHQPNSLGNRADDNEHGLQDGGGLQKGKSGSSTGSSGSSTVSCLMDGNVHTRSTMLSELKRLGNYLLYYL